MTDSDATTDAEIRLRKRRESDGYVFPDYERYCFANVPHTAASLLDVPTDRSLSDAPANKPLPDAPADRTLPDDTLTSVTENVDHVVLVLVDGFGFDCWKRDAEAYPFFADLHQHATVSPLTSIYPSETAAAITSLHTGLEPAEHGLLGWDAYLEEHDEVIQTLPFQTLDGDTTDDESHEPLDDDGNPLDASILFDGNSIYERFDDAGVTVNAIQPQETVDTVYTERVIGPASTTGYWNVPAMGVELRNAIEQTDGPAYHYAYIPNIDSISHHTGTDSDHYQAQLATIGDTLKRQLVDQLDPDIADRTALLVTADHGHVNTEAANAVDLFAHDEITDNLRRRPSGGHIPPVGGPRNAQLWLEPGTVEEVRTFLQSQFAARTFSRDEALDCNLFGTRTPSDRFRDRLGDLVVTHPTRGIYHGDNASRHVGQHGGLSHHEMLVPFAAATLGDLQ